MSRSSFALLTLLASLAGPLVFAPAARSEQPLPPTCPAEAYGLTSVCTPPPSAVHPADDNGLVSYPDYDDYCPYDGEYADAEAEASWRSPTPAPGEDWRDFVVENQSSSISNCYDDLFETLPESNLASAADATVTEADADAYQAASSNAPEYDPYAANAGVDVVEDLEYDSIEAYEAEFSGYGTTDYLRDNFDYEAVASPEAKTSMSQVLYRWGQSALDSDLVTEAVQYGSEAWFTAQQLSQEYSFDAVVDASELAWDRLEEYQRLNRRPLPIVEYEEIGYRLATDDCGWDCWFGMRNEPVTAVPAPVSTPPAPVADNSQLHREALLGAAITLRHLAGQLEAASNWIANLGGIDVAEVKSGVTAR